MYSSYTILYTYKLSTNIFPNLVSNDIYLGIRLRQYVYYGLWTISTTRKMAVPYKLPKRNLYIVVIAVLLIVSKYVTASETRHTIKGKWFQLRSLNFQILLSF